MLGVNILKTGDDCIQLHSNQQLQKISQDVLSSNPKQMKCTGIIKILNYFKREFS